MQGSHRFGLVEVAVEVDFVADSEAVGVVPRVGGVGQHFAAQEAFDGGVGVRAGGDVAWGMAGGTFEEGNLLAVAQVRVGRVLHHARLAVQHDLESSTQGVGLGSEFVDGSDDGGRVGRAAVRSEQRTNLFGAVGAGGVNPLQPQGSLHSDFPVAEGGVREDFGLFGLLEAQEGVHDTADVGVGQFAVLFAEVFA